VKFTDGFWHLRSGVRAAFATEVNDVEVTHGPAGAGLRVLAPTRHIETRGQTLNSPLITLACTSPAPDVLRVRVTHHAGDVEAGPQFALSESSDTDAEVSVEGSRIELTSGGLSLRLSRDAPWQLDFVGAGRLLTSIGHKGLAAMMTADGAHYMVARLDLAVDEHIYGLGERFGPLVKNGQVVDIWNADGGTSSEQAYKNVPFYLSDRGYGVFVNDPGPVSYEVGSEQVSEVQVSVPGDTLDLLVIHGPTPKDVLDRYTALTGRPALPPPWSFGLWLSTSFTTSYDESTVAEFVRGMAERQIPLSVFHFDCFWMREYHWCDFEWDTRTFPDPEGMLKRLKEDEGLRISLWINPYIAQQSALFAEGKERGFLLRRPDGSVWQTDMWQAGMALVDFTNPEATAWYQGKLRVLLDQGVDCFKTDFGERVPTDVVYFDGSDPQGMHNYYTQLYNAAVFEMLEQARGQGEAVVFARSATAGGQQYPVHWGGDSSSTFESMAESLRGGLSLGMSGFGFWSHDIGGFEGTPAPEVFKRWAVFGLLSSHSRLHGSDSYRVPWLVDDEAVDVVREFTELKNRLMPYLFDASHGAHTRGTPVMRAMLLEFPDDPSSAYLDRQYMLGDSLLVAPVFSADGDVSYYVPAGRWTHLLTGETVDGPVWRKETHDFSSLPLLVRPGSVLAMGRRADRPDYDHGDDLTLQVYGLDDGAEVTTTVRAADGSEAGRFVTRRSGDTVSVDRLAGAGAFRVLLVGEQAASAAGAEAVPEGTLVHASADVESVSIRLMRGEEK
jgi:alpha-D-xyloside xylohydrolase